MPIIKILNESDNLPIDLDEIKLFLKIDYNDEDGLIIRSFKTALKQCELNIGLTILEKQYLYSVYNIINNEIKLLYGNIKDVDSIKLININNSETILDRKDYFVDKLSNKIILKNLPTNFYRIDIIYTSCINEISEDLKQAILTHTAKIFEDKLGYSPIPQSSMNIYKNYKIKRL